MLSANRGPPSARIRNSARLFAENGKRKTDRDCRFGHTTGFTYPRVRTQSYVLLSHTWVIRQVSVRLRRRRSRCPHAHVVWMSSAD
jgi:hypothetical protein